MQRMSQNSAWVREDVIIPESENASSKWPPGEAERTPRRSDPGENRGLRAPARRGAESRPVQPRRNGDTIVTGIAQVPSATSHTVRPGDVEVGTIPVLSETCPIRTRNCRARHRPYRTIFGFCVSFVMGALEAPLRDGRREKEHRQTRSPRRRVSLTRPATTGARPPSTVEQAGECPGPRPLPARALPRVAQ